MIPAIITTLMASPVVRKILLGLAVILAVAAAVFFYVEHVKHTAVASYVAAEKVAAATEHDRREAVLTKVQAHAAADVQKIADLQHQNESLQSEIERLSAAHDNEPCLDVDSVRRLDAIGQPGQ